MFVSLTQPGRVLINLSRRHMKKVAQTSLSKLATDLKVPLKIVLSEVRKPESSDMRAKSAEGFGWSGSEGGRAELTPGSLRVIPKSNSVLIKSKGGSSLTKPTKLLGVASEPNKLFNIFPEKQETGPHLIIDSCAGHLSIVKKSKGFEGMAEAKQLTSSGIVKFGDESVETMHMGGNQFLLSTVVSGNIPIDAADRPRLLRNFCERNNVYSAKTLHGFLIKAEMLSLVHHVRHVVAHVEESLKSCGGYIAPELKRSIIISLEHLQNWPAEEPITNFIAEYYNIKDPSEVVVNSFKYAHLYLRGRYISPKLWQDKQACDAFVSCVTNLPKITNYDAYYIYKDLADVEGSLLFSLEELRLGEELERLNESLVLSLKDIRGASWEQDPQH